MLLIVDKLQCAYDACNFSELELVSLNKAPLQAKGASETSDLFWGDALIRYYLLLHCILMLYKKYYYYTCVLANPK